MKFHDAPSKWIFLRALSPNPAASFPALFTLLDWVMGGTLLAPSRFRRVAGWKVFSIRLPFINILRLTSSCHGISFLVIVLRCATFFSSYADPVSQLSFSCSDGTLLLLLGAVCMSFSIHSECNFLFRSQLFLSTSHLSLTPRRAVMFCSEGNLRSQPAHNEKNVCKIVIKIECSFDR